MALPLIGPIISAVSSLGSQWLKQKQQKSQAKHVREIKQIAGEIELDHASVSDMRHSWKDEYLTLLMTTPIIAIFYGAITNSPEVISRMTEALLVLNGLPEWYQWCVIGIVAASFGIRTFNHFAKK